VDDKMFAKLVMKASIGWKLRKRLYGCYVRSCT
jgi:hypothetical protein